jgi:predicted TIM-barrel fold metal-dependent hydrolase
VLPSGPLIGTRLCALAVLAACAASPPATSPAPQPPAPAAAAIVPQVDYHVHLLGPYALPVVEPLPEVSLPAPLRELLDARARLYGPAADAAALPRVFTADAVILDAFIDTRWLRDPADFIKYFGLFNGPPSRYVAHAADIADRAGTIAGTIVDAATGTPQLNFLLGVRRGKDGWRIASEAVTLKNPPKYSQPITAERLIADMDAAGIRRALVLSEAFWIGGPGGMGKRLIAARDAQTAVQLENDWTAAQAARYPDRLVVACGINALADYAIAELVRCKAVPQVRAMKLNIGDGGDDLDLHDEAHVARLRRLFAAAQEHRMAIVIHLGSRGGFGRAEVAIFLDAIVAAAPDVPIQVAHLSSGFQNREALAEFADRRAAGDPRTKNLYFDLSVGSFADLDPALARFIADSVRKIGLEHVLYASDEQPGDHHAPTGRHWTEMRRSLPLTDAEWRAIADNVAPYLRP